VAFVFVLALLLDSACTTACIPAQLEAPSEHCGGPHGTEPSERGCELHGHLKPVVKDRGLVAALTMEEAPAHLETPAIARDHASFHAAAFHGLVHYVPPPRQRSSVLRI